MKVWIHTTPLWKQQSRGQDLSFLPRWPRCWLSFLSRSRSFGARWHTRLSVERPSELSLHSGFCRRFTPSGSGRRRLLRDGVKKGLLPGKKDERTVAFEGLSFCCMGRFG